MSSLRSRGELEASIMGVLWDSPDGLTAQEVRALVVNPQPAITTVITVLERLRNKDAVWRESEPGRSFRYFPVCSRDEDVAKTMLAALEATPDRALALLRFSGTLSESDRDFLRQAIDNT